VNSIYSDSIGQHLHLLDVDGLASDPRAGRHDDEELFPDNMLLRSCTVIIEQEEGQAVFVPSGWYHFVENITTADGGGGGATAADGDGDDDYGNSTTERGGGDALTVSINRNWINSFNIYNVAAFVLREWVAVQRELLHLLEVGERTHTFTLLDSHARSQYEMEVDDSTATDASMWMTGSEWHKHCDVLLRANCALNGSMLLELLASRISLWLALVGETCDGDVGDTNANASATKNYSSWQRMFCPSFLSCYTVTSVDKELFARYRWERCSNSGSINSGSGSGGGSGGGSSSSSSSREAGEEETTTVWQWQCEAVARTLLLLRDTPGFGKFMDVARAGDQREGAVSQALTEMHRVVMILSTAFV
jgi:hypothetical protein